MTSPPPQTPRFWILLPLCLLLAGPGLSGCSSGSADTPPLPDSTFSRVLVEMHLLTARATLDEDLPAGAPDSLLQQYGLEREEVEAALRYYSRRPARLDAIYNAVIDTLGALEQRTRYRSTAPPDASPSGSQNRP